MKMIIVAGIAATDIALHTEGLPSGILHVAEKPLAAISIACIQQAQKKTALYIHSPVRIDPLVKKLSPYLEGDVKMQGIPYTIEEQSDEMLWIRDDLLYDVDFSDLIEDLRKSKNHCTAIFADNMPAMFYKKNIPLMFFKRVFDGEFQSVYPEFKPDMNNLDYCNELLVSFEWQVMQLESGRIHRLDTLKNHREKPMQFMRTELRHIDLSAHQTSIALAKGWRTQSCIPPR